MWSLCLDLKSKRSFQRPSGLLFRNQLLAEITKLTIILRKNESEKRHISWREVNLHGLVSHPVCYLFATIFLHIFFRVRLFFLQLIRVQTLDILMITVWKEEFFFQCRFVRVNCHCSHFFVIENRRVYTTCSTHIVLTWHPRLIIYPSPFEI